MPALLFFVLFYTSYHILSGNRGVMVWLKLSGQVEDLKQQNLALEEQVDLMDKKVSRLHGEGLDPDYIDEQIRRNLPAMHPNERVLFRQ